MSPCKVVCSKCGGRGYRRFWSACYCDTPEPIWEDKPCQDCSGKDYVMERTFEEKESEPTSS